jgi:Flp pilus assembly protein TadG
LRRARSRGQALVEFALVSTVMLVIVLGIVDFGYLFASRGGMYGAGRGAARFAATHPTAWTASANPAATTIEGNLNLAAVPAKVPNDDAHITITYLVPGAAAATACGSWSATAGAFQAQPGYSQATCAAPGHLVQVTAVFVYAFITPLLRSTFSSVNVTVTSAAQVE